MSKAWESEARSHRIATSLVTSLDEMKTALAQGCPVMMPWSDFGSPSDFPPIRPTVHGIDAAGQRALVTLRWSNERVWISLDQLKRMEERVRLCQEKSFE